MKGTTCGAASFDTVLIPTVCHSAVAMGVRLRILLSYPVGRIGSPALVFPARRSLARRLVIVWPLPSLMTFEDDKLPRHPNLPRPCHCENRSSTVVGGQCAFGAPTPKRKTGTCPPRRCQRRCDWDCRGQWQWHHKPCWLTFIESYYS
jgi:hypothetical protein